MKYLIGLVLVVLYTFGVYKGTVHYHYNIKDHIIYGQVIPYEFMNDGDIARVHLHYTDEADEFIDSVTLTNVMPTFDIEHPTMGSMHIDIASMQLMLRDRGQWIQFESYDELNNYIASRFPSDEYDN